MILYKTKTACAYADVTQHNSAVKFLDVYTNLGYNIIEKLLSRCQESEGDGYGCNETIKRTDIDEQLCILSGDAGTEADPAAAGVYSGEEDPADPYGGSGKNHEGEVSVEGDTAGSLCRRCGWRGL